MARQIRIVFLVSILAALLLFTAALDAQQATPEVTLDVASLAEKRIVYLVSASLDPAESGLRATERVAEVFPVQIAFTWDDFTELEAEQPADALIIDVSALDQVDAEWLANAYRNGVLIATFNVPVDQFAELVDDQLLTLDGFAADPYPGDFFIMASSAHEGCAPDAEATEEPLSRGQTTSIGSRSSATNTLDTVEDLQFFAHLLERQLEDIAETRETGCAYAMEAGES